MFISKKKNILIILFVILYINTNKINSAEIIDNIKIEEKKFVDWDVTCNEDIMVDDVDCKIHSKFYNDTSSIYIQPNNKVANQVVIMIPSVIENTTVKFKVDKNPIINSDIIETLPAYGVIPFSPNNQKLMFSQLKDGNELYIRFTVRDLKSSGGIKEITVKISLIDMPKILTYYEVKMK